MDTGCSAKNLKIESFAVDADGIRTRDKLNFVEAVTAAMELKLKSPHSYIRVCDSNEPTATPSHQNTTVAA
jgi:hypothetical protein